MTPQKCAHCGATIDPLALSCPYCKLTTPAGVAAQQRADQLAHVHAARVAQEQHALHLSGSQRMRSTSNQALGWSLASLVLCCLPLGVVAIVQGARARSMAARLGVPAPGTATAGLILGVVGCLMSAGFVTWAIIAGELDQAASNQRVDALQRQIGDGASAARLDPAVACALSEMHARRNGWDGHDGYTLEAFECGGKLQATAKDQAQLEDFRFKYRSSSQIYALHACFKRGTKWYVSELRSSPCP